MGNRELGVLGMKFWRCVLGSLGSFEVRFVLVSELRVNCLEFSSFRRVEVDYVFLRFGLYFVMFVG